MGKKLTNNLDVPFILCFQYKLEKGYTLKELTKRNNKELQGFLDKVSKMSVQEVDKTFGRKPDKNDTYNNEQVYHYGVTDQFRIHVINQNGRYVIIRIDPNHKKHNK